MPERPGASSEEAQISCELQQLRELIKKKNDLTPWITLLTVLVAVVGLYFSVREFDEQQRAAFQQKYWEKQVEIYSRACDAAASISKAAQLSEVQKERDTFRTLYWGSMSIVEHPEVKDAMNDFIKALDAWQDNPNSKPKEIEKLSYRLAVCCRKSLRKTWDPANIGSLDTSACPY